MAQSVDMAGSVGLRVVAGRGARWGALAGAGEQLLSTLVTIALTRILAPREIGLVAAAGIVSGAFALLTQFGVAQNLVRRKTIDERVIATAFWTITGLTAVLAVTVSLAARPLAAAVGAPEAARLLPVLMLTLVLRASANVPRALLQRRLAYRSLYSCDLLSFSVYAVAQVLFALEGFGAMSIVLGQLLSAGVLLVLQLTAAHWLPSRTFSRQALREDRRFGFGMFATMSLSYAVKNADYLVVSLLGTPRLLGVYYIAYVLPNILRQRVTWMTADVLLPAFAAMQDQLERTRVAYRDSLAMHTLAGLPSMVGITVVSPTLIGAFFGQQWAAAASPLRWLALAAGAEFVTQAASTLLLAHGRVLVLSSVQLLRLVVLIGMALPVVGLMGFSLDRVAVCVLVATLSSGLYAQVKAFQLLKWSASHVMGTQLAIVLATLGMAIAVLAVPVPDNDVLALSVQIVTGLLTMGLLIRLVLRRWLERPSTELLRIILPGGLRQKLAAA